VIEPTFNLFVYGTLQSGGAAADRLAGCERIADATVGGVLYDIDGQFPALVIYDDEPVPGEVWRCPADLLEKLDAYESIASGLFRRVGVTAKDDAGTEHACWAYVAGPKLSRKLTRARRIPSWSPTGK
jgi:gamma-glutamylcyclotransferase (GGCT)/AIG2-like uncharacterized protein YtfP